MKTKITLLLLFLIPIVSIAQTEYYVSPSGSSSGDGTEANPWDLQTALDPALNSTTILPGDTIWLRGGDYKGRFVSKISGDATSNITVASYQDEIAVLDGNDNSGNGVILTVEGYRVTFMDFEITMKGNFSRNSLDSNFQLVTGVNHIIGEVVDSACKFINLVIYNCPGSGFNSWKFTEDTKIYGCLIYNNGYQDGVGNPRGVGMYVQNASKKFRQIENNILFNNFKSGVQIWSSENNPEYPYDYVQYVNFENNVVLNSGSPMYVLRENFIAASRSKDIGNNIPNHINVKNNFLYHNFNGINGTDAGERTGGESLRIGEFGSTDNPGNSIVVDNNYIIGTKAALYFGAVDEITFTNNIVRTNYFFMNGNYPNHINDVDWDLSDNIYYHKKYGYLGNALYEISGLGRRSLPNFNSTFNLDYGSTSTEYENYTLGSNKLISITENEYNSNLYKVVVSDETGNDVNVNFATEGFIIEDGMRYKIIDAENYHSTTPKIGVINGGTISFPMDNTDLDPVIGTFPLSGNELKTDHKVGVFLIEFEDICKTETTWTAGAWSNGVPDEFKKAIIDDVYNSISDGEFTACSLELTDNVNASFTIEPNTTITIVNNLINKNTPENFIIKDDASLVMIEDDGIVSGDITVEKKWAAHLFNPANSPGVNSDKYSIWATPMVKEDSQINNTFSNSAVTYYWDTSLSPNQYDQLGGSEKLVPGRGYYLRQNNGSDFDINVPRQFIGVINNGVIEESTVNFSDDEIEAPFENGHFFGNPYPSAILWSEFYDDNKKEIEGTVYLWKQDNNTTVGQYIEPEFVTFNGVGSLPPNSFDGFISTAQGFATTLIDSTEGSVRSIQFKNSQRITGNNTQFFKTASSSKRVNNPNTNKIWLQLNNGVSGNSQLLGFLPESSNSYNSFYDGRFLNQDSAIQFYSVLENYKLAIQGREELTVNSDAIPLGYKVTSSGDYTIEITQEFISTNFEIILEDTLTSVFTNLRTGSYEFNVPNAIEDNTRFILHFNYVDPTVIASFEYEKQCDSYGFDIDFDFTGGTENASFLWDFGVDALPQNSTDENPVGVVFPEGDYDVTLTVSKNGTVNSITQTISVIDVGSYGTNKVIICHNGENVITVSVNALQTHLNHGDCIGACESNTASKGKIKSKIVNDKHVVLFNDKITLYPNPTTGRLFIDLGLEEGYDALRIIDISGRLVLEEVVHESKMDLNVSNFSNGIYFLSIMYKDELVGMKKFIKK